jgi:hypothetical protein
MSHWSSAVNAINVISPYKYLGMWVFDDAKVGLVQEPFVGGADVIIDRAVEGIPNARATSSAYRGNELVEAVTTTTRTLTI